MRLFWGVVFVLAVCAAWDQGGAYKLRQHQIQTPPTYLEYGYATVAKFLEEKPKNDKWFVEEQKPRYNWNCLPQWATLNSEGPVNPYPVRRHH